MVQSLVSNLLYNLLAISKGEINRFEKLYVIHNTSHLWEVNKSYMADLYLECGIFSEARKVFEERQSIRKMGDLAWIAKDIETAKIYYSTETNIHKPDWDRLLRLAYYERDWVEVLRLFNNMDAYPISIDNQFVLGSSAVPVAPIRTIVLLSLIRLNLSLDSELLKRFKKTMGCQKSELSECYNALSTYSDKNVVALDKRLRPRLVDREAVTLKDALEKGDTILSNELMKYILNSDAIAREAREELVEFLSSGNERHLQNYITVITKSYVYSVTEVMLLYTMENDSQLSRYSNINVIKLFGSHPCMNKRYFGKYLAYKLKESMPMDGQDIVTGLFQNYATSIDIVKKFPLGYNKLVSVRNWAVYKCQEWIGTVGQEFINAFTDHWLNQACTAAKTLFANGKGDPREPRDTSEWYKIVNECEKWLAEEWKKEIEGTQWKSERQLFSLVKKAFVGNSIIFHASPCWLSPQHYDIYIPELKIAIEYMGKQHYEPIEYFGGKSGFVETIARDEKKKAISKSCGIRIHYVKYNENLGDAVNRIVNLVSGGKSCNTTQ